MKFSIFPEFRQKTTILTWMSRQEGFVATETQAKVPNVCGLQEIPAKDKYSDPSLEILTKDLAVANELVRMLGGIGIGDRYANATNIIKVGGLKIVMVAKAHDFWKVCRALKTISFVNTEKEMVKGTFEGELLAGEVYLKDGEITFSGGIITSRTIQLREENYPNHLEMAQWLVAHPLYELAAVTSEISAEGKPQPAMPAIKPRKVEPVLADLAFHKEADYEGEKGRWQAFLDWAGERAVPIVLKDSTYTVQFDGRYDRVDLMAKWGLKINFRFGSVPAREVLDKVQVLLGLTDVNLVSRVESLGLTIESLYALGFRKAGAEKFYEFVQRSGFVARYDISKKEMTTSQSFVLADVTPEQLAEAKAKLEAFIAKVMDAAENRPKEV
jgi:hypothetical protein